MGNEYDRLLSTVYGKGCAVSIKRNDRSFGYRRSDYFVTYMQKLAPHNLPLVTNVFSPSLSSLIQFPYVDDYLNQGQDSPLNVRAFGKQND